MVTCSVSCPIFNRCGDKTEWKPCIYSYGLNDDDENDAFLERLTY